MHFILDGDQIEDYPHLAAQMFKLRARVFRDELGWVDTEGDEERDFYDDCDPCYIMHTDPTGQHLYAAARLMPTTGPTLLADVFGETLPDIEFASPFVWEITRLAVDDELIAQHGLGRERLTILRNMLLAGMEFGVANHIDSFLANFDNARLRMWRWLGAEFDVLGTSTSFSTTVHLGLIESTPASLDALQERLGITAPMLGSPPPRTCADAAALPLRAAA